MTTLNRIIHALDAVTVVTNGATVYPNYVRGRCVAQAEITGGTATVVVQGRADDNAPWASLGVLSEADMGSNSTALLDVTSMPQMRMVVANVSGSTTSGWLVFE